MKNIIFVLIALQLLIISTSFSEEWKILSSSNSDLPNDYIFDIAHNVDDGSSWIGSNAGLSHYQNGVINTFNKSNTALSSEMISCVELDGDKVIFSQESNGLVLLEGTQWTFINEANSDLPNNSINDIMVEGNLHYWISTRSGLLEIVDKAFIIYDSLSSDLPSNYVLCSEKIRNEMWVGTNRGLVKMVDGIITVFDKTNSILPYNLIWTIKAQGNILWVGTAYGLLKIDGDKWEVIDPNKLCNKNVNIRAIEVENDSVVWIGSGYELPGITKFDGTNWTTFTPFNSIPQNQMITSIKVDKYGNKWFGSTGSGIAIYNEDKIVSVGEDIKMDFEISPNPASDYIDINLERWSPSSVWTPSEIQIYNSLGQCVMSVGAIHEPIDRRSQLPLHRLDISALSPGLYFVSFNNGKETLNGSFIVLR